MLGLINNVAAIYGYSNGPSNLQRSSEEDSRGAEAIDLLANAAGILLFVILYGIVKMIDMIKRHIKEPELEEEHARSPY